MDNTVISYGGIEILSAIFEALAMLMNGKTGSLYQPFVAIGSVAGLSWVILKLSFSNTPTSTLFNYFVPFTLIITVLLLPTGDVHIKDALLNKQKKVSHVPLFAASFAGMLSSASYKVSQALEGVMHTNNDNSYNKTGIIFGASTAQDVKKFKLTDPSIEKKLRQFCKKCIVYDLALDRYKIEELTKASNLLEFLEERSSKASGMNYDGEGKSCRESITEIKKSIREKELPYFQNNEILAQLPLSYKAIGSLSQQASDIIQQQLVLNVLDDSLSSKDFAAERAYINQRGMFSTVGSLGGKGVIILQTVIFALLIASYIFIVPLSLFPNGIKYIINWLWMLVWTQLWPPFYVIINYIMLVAGQAYAKTTLLGDGLSHFNAIGIQNIYADIEALAGYMIIFVPYLSYIILQGGMGSFVHLASSLNSPTMSAASIASNEMLSGNYSYGNINMGNAQFASASYWQKNLSPSSKVGYTSLDDSLGTQLTSGSRQYFTQHRDSIDGNPMLHSSLTATGKVAESNLVSHSKTEAKTFSENASSMWEKNTALAEDLSKNMRFNEALNTAENRQYCKNWSTLQQAIESYSKTHGVTEQRAQAAVASASAGMSTGPIGKLFGIEFEGKLDGSKEERNSTADGKDEALRSETQDSIQESWSGIDSYMKNISVDEGMGKSSSLQSSARDSYNETVSSGKQLSSTLNKLDQVQKELSFAESDSLAYTQSLAKDFRDWNFFHHGSAGFDIAQGLYGTDNQQELYQEYSRDRCEKIGGGKLSFEQAKQRIEQNHKDVELPENIKERQLEGSGKLTTDAEARGLTPEAIEKQKEEILKKEAAAKRSKLIFSDTAQGTMRIIEKEVKL